MQVDGTVGSHVYAEFLADLTGKLRPATIFQKFYTIPRGLPSPAAKAVVLDANGEERILSCTGTLWATDRVVYTDTLDGHRPLQSRSADKRAVQCMALHFSSLIRSRLYWWRTGAAANSTAASAAAAASCLACCCCCV